MTCLEGMVDICHHGIKGYVEEFLGKMVVGHLEHEPAAEGVVGETGECGVLTPLTYAVGEFQVGVLAAEHEHPRGNGTDGVVEHFVDVFLQCHHTATVSTVVVGGMLKPIGKTAHVDVFGLAVRCEGHRTIALQEAESGGGHSAHGDGMLPIGIAPQHFLHEQMTSEEDGRQVDGVAFH